LYFCSYKDEKTGRVPVRIFPGEKEICLGMPGWEGKKKEGGKATRWEAGGKEGDGGNSGILIFPQNG
jgi:hypothetical protein